MLAMITRGFICIVSTYEKNEKSAFPNNKERGPTERPSADFDQAAK